MGLYGSITECAQINFSFPYVFSKIFGCYEFHRSCLIFYALSCFSNKHCINTNVKIYCTCMHECETHRQRQRDRYALKTHFHLSRSTKSSQLPIWQPQASAVLGGKVTKCKTHTVVVMELASLSQRQRLSQRYQKPSTINTFSHYLKMGK